MTVRETNHSENPGRPQDFDSKGKPVEPWKIALIERTTATPLSNVLPPRIDVTTSTSSNSAPVGQWQGLAKDEPRGMELARQEQKSFPQSWYRPRFLVLPTGRTILAWGVFDTKDGKPLPTGIPQRSDFVIRVRTLGKAMAFARRLNEKHEQKRAA
jgi:hypothetical protein